MSVKQKLVRLLERSATVKRLLVWAVLQKRRLKFRRFYSETAPLDDDLVLFEAFGGRKYACNPKAIYLQMLTDPDWRDKKKVWCFREPAAFSDLQENPNTEVVRYRSDRYYELYGKARYAVTNYRLPRELKKRADQIFVQTWHGVPLKKLGYDLSSYTEHGVSAAQLHRQYDLAIRQCSLFLSPSRYFTEKITSAFALTDAQRDALLVETGYPRNDFLYRFTEADRRRVRETLHLPADKKIALYCPTYRDNQSAAGVGHTYELGVDFAWLREELGDAYCILFRTHYLISNAFDFGAFEGFLYDVSNYEEINDLYLASDLLITDYSSVLFDYAILNRPILLYMYDFEEYKNRLRDFYLGLDELPSEPLFTQRELTDAMRGLLKDGFVCTARQRAFNERHNALNGPNTSLAVLDCMKRLRLTAAEKE